MVIGIRRSPLNLVEDYFLLYHGIRYHQKHCFLNLKLKIENDFLEIAAIFLAVNRKNYNNFLSTPIFQKFIDDYFKSHTTNLDDIYEYQYNIFEFFISKLSKKELGLLLEYFIFLKNSGIITTEEYNKLANIVQIIIKKKSSHSIHLVPKDDQPREKKQDFLHTQKNMILKLVKEYEEISNEHLDDLRDIFDRQRFSIGVTGIINAGKSTLLNALMKESLLGTSVVPETASLTIIKYAKNKEAIVRFWNEKEWDKIEQQAKHLKSILDFVKETKNFFGNDLKKYIQPKNRTIKINTGELSRYTSANDASKFCNLVRDIELYSDVEFLKEGIEIVDTPGLDDPVIQREEITRSYLGKCDTLMHLMNVNQAATMSDINFIIDTVLYHNISKLIIILTKADTVNKEELDEVLEYTKKSIKKVLRNINKGEKYDFLISKLEFIPVSAKMALLDQADKQRYERSGILKVENLLKTLIFGKENQKNQILINSVKLKLLDIISSKIEAITLELELLTKSDEEIKELVKILKAQKEKNKKLFEDIENEIKIENFYIKEQLQISKKIVFDKISSLGELLTQRIVDDIRYELKNNKSLPKLERITYIFESGKKDGLFDIIRDYNYALFKQISSSKEKLSSRFEDISLDIDTEYDWKLDNEFVDKIILSNNTLVTQKISTLLKSAKLKNMDKFQQELSSLIRKHLDDLKDSLDEMLKSLDKKRVNEYTKEVDKPLKKLQKSITQKESILKQRVKETTLSQKEKNEKTGKLYEKLTGLRKLNEKLTKVTS